MAVFCRERDGRWRGEEGGGVLSGLAWLSLALTWLFVFLLSPWQNSIKSLLHKARCALKIKNEADSAAIGLKMSAPGFTSLLVPEESLRFLC